MMGEVVTLLPTGNIYGDADPEWVQSLNFITVLFIGSVTVELHDGHTVTRFADGATVPASPQDTDAYRGRARELGYADDTAAMSRDHELCHSLLAALLSLPESPTLRGVADGKHWPHWRAEESAVLGLQAYARAAGVDLVTVAERLA